MDSRDGISLLQKVSGLESKIAFSELVSFSGTDELNTREHDKANVIIEIAPQMTVIESKSHGPLHQGATSAYMDIDVC